MEKQIFISKSETETEKIAFEFAKSLKSGDFIAFYGEMGSGKTAFVRGLARFFEYEDSVTSPTFAIVNEYRGKMPIFHFDMYRITGEDDLYSTGFYDYFDRNGIIAAEWSENIEFALPPEYIKISFERTETENGRRISIQRV